MYIVELKNGDVTTEIHGLREKLRSGKVVKGISCIDSFTFTLLPSNVGFNLIRDFTTFVSVYNTARNRYEFQGRVLFPSPSMSDSGLIAKDVTCESFFGFLCDSEQEYVEERNWKVRELVEHIFNVHNSMVEDYKRFEIGEITVSDPNDNIYIGIQRNNTWKTIEEKLLGTLGGEIRFRVVDGVIYFDWLQEIGTTKTTPIKLSRNMKSITQEKDPTAYVTRLIPYGCKLKATDEEGNETELEERLTIESVNNGVKYIDDEEAKAEYGIHVGSIELDDVTDPQNLLTKGREWLENNNKVQIKYSVSALDLSLLGLDVDDFDVGNYHPIINPLLGIDDVAKIIKKTIDVCEEVQSTIEIGDNFKTLSDLQLEQSNNVKTLSNTLNQSASKYATAQRLQEETKKLWQAMPSAEDGVSGNWSYTKHDDGKCELWGVFDIENVDCSTEENGVFRTNDIAVENLPFAVSGLKVVASYDGNGILCSKPSEVEDTLPGYYLVWLSSAAMTGKLTLHVVGNWI